MITKNILKKVGILCISTVTGSATAIASIIPILSINYPNQSLSSIESLVTISSLSALFTILTNNWITKRIDVKQTIILGSYRALLSSFTRSNFLFL